MKDYFGIPQAWKEFWTKYPHGYSVFEMLADWASKANDLADKVTKKTDLHGDHKGTWQGLQPTQTEPGLTALVEGLPERIDENEEAILTKKLSDVLAARNEIHGMSQQDIHTSPRTIVRAPSGKHQMSIGLVNTGSKLLVAWREGESHTSYDGVIKTRESTDGQTWTNEKTIVVDSQDSRGAKFIKTLAGTILMKYYVRTAGQPTITKVIRSLNEGTTWGTPIVVPNPPGYNGLATDGEFLQLPSGRILFCGYLVDRVPVMYSDDDGVTWHYLSQINNPAEYKINETTLYFQNNILYAIARNAKDTLSRMFLVRSLDYGQTWEKPKEMPIFGHSPSVFLLSTGRVLLTYRNPNTNFTKNAAFADFNMVMLRDQEIDSDQVILEHSTGNTDVGYGSTALFNDEIYIAYYDRAGAGVVYHTFTLAELARIRKGYTMYEQGSWTPAIAGATTAGNNTYSNRHGGFFRIGKLVFIYGRISMSAKDAAMAGSTIITGLPFISTNLAHSAISLGFVANLGLSANYTYHTGHINANSREIAIRQSGNDQASGAVSVAHVKDNTSIYFSGMYQIK